MERPVSRIRQFWQYLSVTGIELPLDFETTPETKDFVDFAGGVVSVVNNPNPAGINVTSKVGKMVKYGGETWVEVQ